MRTVSSNRYAASPIADSFDVRPNKSEHIKSLVVEQLVSDPETVPVRFVGQNCPSDVEAASPNDRSHKYWHDEKREQAKAVSDDTRFTLYEPQSASKRMPRPTEPTRRTTDPSLNHNGNLKSTAAIVVWRRSSQIHRCE